MGRYFGHSSAIEAGTPLELGRHRPALKRIRKRLIALIIVALIGLYSVASGVVLLQDSSPYAAGALLLGIPIAFFSVPLALALPFMAVEASADGVRIRPWFLPGGRADFAKVSSIVIFPEVLTQAGVQTLLVFLRANGRRLWALNSPPYSEELIMGLATLAHRHHGAPVYICSGPVAESEITLRLKLPQLINGAEPQKARDMKPNFPLL